MKIFVPFSFMAFHFVSIFHHSKAFSICYLTKTGAIYLNETKSIQLLKPKYTIHKHASDENKYMRM